MSANICNICGANLIYKDGKWMCPACGAFKTEEISNEEVTLLYNAAQKLRLASFDDAEEAYRDIIAKYPENSEAHWGLVLSKYGIKYEDDYDGKKLPTCYATSIESVLTDKDYLDAVRLCKDKYQKEYYIEQGKVLEKIRVEWLEKASKEPKYDVFLCFKDSDKLNNMERTDDSIEVANLYTHLSSLGYKVFYSRESLRDKVAEKYEPYIYNALNTASVMIVYGSKIEYFSSVWMKNEWTRYVRRLREGLKIEGSLVIACDGVNPGDLPRPLNQMQVLDARKKTFYGDLEAHIAKIISVARRPKATVERVEISSAIGKKKASIDNQIKTIKVGGGVGKKTPVVIDNAVSVREIGRYEVPALTPDEDTKLKSIAQFLRSGLFDPANKVADELLKKNKYNGQALLAKLLVEYSAKSIDELSEKINDINDFSIIHSVIEYNDKEIGEKVIGIICSKIEVAIQNGDYNKAVSYFKEISEYNSVNVGSTRTTLRNKATELLKLNPNEADKIFGLLLSTYSDADSYVSYLHGMIDDCLKVKNVAIAKKYNDKILELDDGDVKATFNAVYLSVSACDIKEFIGLIDLYADFSKLDNAIRHFDAEEIVVCFYTLQQIFFGALQSGKSGETLSKWFDFIVKYEFDTRKDFIEKTLNELADVKSLQSRAKLFDHVISCVDGSDVDRHIELRLSLADKLRIGGEFSLAEKYYKEVIDIEEGNCNALWGILLCKLKANRESDISEKIDNFTYFSELEVMLKYCSDEKTRVDYLDKLSAAVIMKSANLTDKTNIEKLSKVFDGIIKYYPEEFNGSLINYIQKFADNCKNSSAFSLAEKYYAMVLSIDNMRHSAYWGLLQAKLNCRNNDDLIKQNKIITEFTEFSSAIAASSGDERSSERYCQIAKNQLDYIEKQKTVAKQKKKRKSFIKKLTAAVAIMVAIVIGVFAFVGYRKSESVLKFSSNPTGVSVYAGKYYNSAIVEIPASNGNRPVTEIADNAFSGKNNITKVVLPSTITKIGNNAFSRATALESINIPDSVTYIGNSAFNGCKNLKTIMIPEKTAEIGNAVFAGCENLTEITIVAREGDINGFAEDWKAGLQSSTKIKMGFVINLDYNGATSDVDTNKPVVGVNENYTLPAPVRNGYKFLGWYDSLKNGNRLTDESGRSVSVYQQEESITAYARWEANLNSIIFDANGGNGTMQNQQIATDSSAILSGCSFTKVGYTFIGWGATATQKTYDDKAEYAMGANSTYRLFAIWQANVNTLRFNANGGNGTMSAMNIKTDETKTLTACGFSRKGYDFAGWATSENGIKAYSDKANYLMSSDSEYTLYALWAPTKYKITYNLNGGSVSNANKTEYTIESETFTLTNPTRPGYKFNGWSGTGIIEQIKEITIGKGSTDNRSYVANWQANVNTLHFDTNGGVGEMADINIATDNSFILPANSFSRNGYTFRGWSVTADGTKVFDDKSNYTMGSNSEYTLYANWSADFEFMVMRDGTVKILSTNLTVDNISIPEFIDDYLVSMIGENAFKNSGIKRINLPSNITKIEKSAFENCISLESIDLPQSLLYIEKDAFFDSGLESITIPENMVYIKSNAFGCSKLNRIFYNAISLQADYDSTNSLKSKVFYGKTFDLVIGASVLNIPAYLFSGCSINQISFVSNSYLNSIDKYAFYGAKIQDYIDFPNSLTIIGSSAFKNVLFGTPVYLPKTITNLGYDSFGFDDGSKEYLIPSFYCEDSSSENYSEVFGYYPWHYNKVILGYKFGEVIFKANGAIGEMPNQFVGNGKNVGLNINVFSKDGYTFRGWSTTQDGVVEYLDQDMYSLDFVNGCTLYAVWEANTNRLIFNGNGATSGGMDEMSIKTDESTILTDCGFAKIGYSFKGWATESNGSVKYSNKATYTMGTESSYTLYAVWQINQYTITLELNGGTASKNSITQDYNSVVDSPVATRSGYDFVEWYADSDFATVYNFSTMAAKNITVYAKWQMKTSGDELIGIRNYDEFKGIKNYPNGNFYLEKDIVLDSTWQTIESFSGKLDGRSKNITYINDQGVNGNSSLICVNNGTITNLNIIITIKNTFNESKNYGFVAETNHGSITSINISGKLDVNLSVNTKFSEDYYYFGTVCGLDDGTLSDINCSAEFNLASVNSYERNLGWVYSSYNYNLCIGGIVGKTSYLKNCYVKSNIYAKSYLSGENNGCYLPVVIGGIAGEMTGCEHCSFEGAIKEYCAWACGGIAGKKVSGENITKSYAINYYTNWRVYYLGGLVGSCLDNIIDECYVINTYNMTNNEYTECENIGGIVGYANSNLTIRNSFVVNLNTDKMKETVGEYISPIISSPYGTNVTIENCQALSKEPNDYYEIVNNIGWDLSKWVIGYDSPLFLDDTYITVSYKNTESASTNKNPSAYKKNSDGFVLSSIIKGGYTFGGWYSDSSYTTKVEKVVNITEPLTLYAKWTPNNYTVTLNTVGGEVSKNTATVTYDSDYTLEVPTRLGYTFLGWYDGTGNSAVAYTDEIGKSLGKWNSTDGTTLYAKWQANTNVILFNGNGADFGVVGKITGQTDSYVRLPSNTFSKENYEFCGWSSSANGNVELYDNDLFLVGTKSSYMLYAVWQLGEREDYADYIPISTAEDLKRISDNLSGKYYLVNDIDLYNIEWIPIGSIYEYNTSNYRVDDCSFTGVLDGNGFSIYNLTSRYGTVYYLSKNASKDFYYGGGLFGYNKGVIKNLKIYNSEDHFDLVDDTYSSSYAFYQYVYGGILCAYNSGTIINCYAQGSISFTTKKNISKDENHYLGNNYLMGVSLGGIVGFGDVSNCSADVSITSSVNSTLGKVTPNIENVKDLSIDDISWKDYKIRYLIENGTYRYQFAKYHALVKTIDYPTKKEGYSFGGWSKTENGSIDYFVGDECFIPIGSTSLTLYPVWIPNNNAIKFNPNGGIGEMSDQMLATGTTHFLNKNLFSKDGYHFIGWTETENDGVKYLDGANYTMGVESDYVLYAVWEANENKILFNSTLGSGEMDSQIIKTDETVTLNACSFLPPSGYYFIGWTDEEKGTDVKYTDCASFTMTTDPSITLYAIWEKVKT